MEVFVRSPQAQLVVARDIFSDTTTIGKLHILKTLFCFTLEDTVRAGADGILQRSEKIQDKTAIPTGIFELELEVSGRFGFCPFICGAAMLDPIDKKPLFEDVRMHWGNFEADTRGCILVGRTKDTDMLGESKLAFKELIYALVPMRRAERLYIEVVGGPSKLDIIRRAA